MKIDNILELFKKHSKEKEIEKIKEEIGKQLKNYSWFNGIATIESPNKELGISIRVFPGRKLEALKQIPKIENIYVEVIEKPLAQA